MSILRRSYFFNNLNPGEKRAIKALVRLANIWPGTLSLYINSGTLHVIDETVTNLPNDTRTVAGFHRSFFRSIEVPTAISKLPIDSGDAEEAPEDSEV